MASTFVPIEVNHVMHSLSDSATRRLNTLIQIQSNLDTWIWCVACEVIHYQNIIETVFTGVSQFCTAKSHFSERMLVAYSFHIRIEV